MHTLIKVQHVMGAGNLPEFGAPDSESYKHMHLEVSYTSEPRTLLPLTIRWGYNDSTSSATLYCSHYQESRLDNVHSAFKYIRRELTDIHPDAGEMLEKMLVEVLVKVGD